MTTAAGVPETHATKADELESDEAFETLRSTGLRLLVRDTITRFRAGDGFSHARALAFQIVLTLLPTLAFIVGLAATLETDELRTIVQDTFNDIAPGPAGQVFTAGLEDRDGSSSAALVAGLAGALLAGTTTMAQVERAANRLYGVEKDRPFLRRYGVALGLAITAGALLGLALAVLVAGNIIRREVGLDDDFIEVVTYPLGVVAVVGAVALLFEFAPRRKQPEASWLAVGAGLASILWFAFMQALDGYFELSESLGTTYGPIAGTLGVLLWAFLTALALLLGLAFTAQLEAVRAGTPTPRVDREDNL